MRPRRRNGNNINKIFERLLLQSVIYVCDWMSLFAAYQKEHPELAAETVAIQHREPPQGWDKEIPTFPPDPKGIASRDSPGKVLTRLLRTIRGWSAVPRISRRRPNSTHLSECRVSDAEERRADGFSVSPAHSHFSELGALVDSRNATASSRVLKLPSE